MLEQVISEFVRASRALWATYAPRANPECRAAFDAYLEALGNLYAEGLTQADAESSCV